MRYMTQSAIRREKTTEITFSTLAYRNEYAAMAMLGLHGGLREGQGYRRPHR